MKEIFNNYLDIHKVIFQEMNKYLEMNKEDLTMIPKSEMLIKISDYFNDTYNNGDLKCIVSYASLHLINTCSSIIEKQKFDRLECYVNMGNPDFNKFNLERIVLKKETEVQNEMSELLKKHMFNSLRSKINVVYKFLEECLIIEIIHKDFVRSVTYPNNIIHKLNKISSIGGHILKSEFEERTEEKIENFLKTVQQLYPTYPEEMLNVIINGKKLSLEFIENINLVNDLKCDILNEVNFLININEFEYKKNKKNIIKKGNNI